MTKDRYKIHDLVDSKLNKSISFYYTNDENAVKNIKTKIEKYINSNPDSDLARCIVSHEASWNNKKFKICHMTADRVSIDFESDPSYYNDSVIEDFLSDEDMLPVADKQANVRKTFCGRYGMSEHDAEIITKSKENTDFFEEAAIGLSEKEVSRLYSMFVGDMMALLKTTGKNINDTAIRPIDFADLVKLVESCVINMATAKDILAEIIETGGNPTAIVESRNLKLMDNEDELKNLVDKVISENPESVADISSGKKAAIGFLVGKVMKLSSGKADPKLVNEMITTKLMR